MDLLVAAATLAGSAVLYVIVREGSKRNRPIVGVDEERQTVRFELRGSVAVVVVVVVTLGLAGGCTPPALLRGASQAQSASCGAPGTGASFSAAAPSTGGRAVDAPRDAAVDEAPECRMGTDGRQACGYHCKMGTDGVMVCADTPNGRCAMGSDGRVTCSQLRNDARADDPPPECRRGTDGKNTCGYNCRMGTNGRFYCASTPNGRCAMNTDGTFTCS